MPPPVPEVQLGFENEGAHVGVLVTIDGRVPREARWTPERARAVAAKLLEAARAAEEWRTIVGDTTPSGPIDAARP